jgi:hypothetical protein
MRSQKLLWGMLLLACGLLLQVSCSEMEMEMDKADSGRIVTRSGKSKVIQSYWDGANQEIHVQFAHDIGTVLVSVCDAKGHAVYGSILQSSVASQSIKLPQLPSGDYTLTLSDAKDSKTSLAFSIL